MFLSWQESHYVTPAQGLQVIGSPGLPLSIRPDLAFSGLLRQGVLWPGPLFVLGSSGVRAALVVESI